jgi:hypothetical protein
MRINKIVVYAKLKYAGQWQLYIGHYSVIVSAPFTAGIMQVFVLNLTVER